jgi:hypothetical protein
MVASRKRTPQMFMPTAPVPAAPTNAANMFTGPLKKKRDFDWASLLQGVGAGLLTGRNVGEGLGQGLILAQQIGDQRADNDRQQERIDRENARFDYTMQRDVKADQAAQDQLAQFNATIDGLSIPDDQKAFLKAMGPGSASFKDMYPVADPVKGIEIGGKLVDPITGREIADYSDAEMLLRTASAPKTTVNMGPTGIDYGDPEKGLAWARNPDGTVRLDERGAPIALPYQGGSVYSAEQQAAQKQAGSDATKQQTATIVTQDIGRARDLVKGATLPTTGLVGNFLKDVGGTEANDVRALVQTIRANVGFDKLQDMRANSPTGGALGPVSDAENALLQSTLGNLEQSQTKEQFIQNLNRLETIYDQVINGPKSRTKDDDTRPSTVIDGYTIRLK